MRTIQRLLLCITPILLIGCAAPGQHVPLVSPGFHRLVLADDRTTEGDITRFAAAVFKPYPPTLPTQPPDPLQIEFDKTAVVSASLEVEAVKLPQLRTNGAQVTYVGGRDGRVDATDIVTHAEHRNYGIVRHPKLDRFVVLALEDCQQPIPLPPDWSTKQSDLKVTIVGAPTEINLPTGTYVLVTFDPATNKWVAGPVQNIVSPTAPDYAKWSERVEYELLLILKESAQKYWDAAP